MAENRPVAPPLRSRGWLTLALCAALALPVGFWLAQPGSAPSTGGPDAGEGDIAWLQERSMLSQSAAQAALVSDRGLQWRHPYGAPRPRDIVRQAPAWLLDYPGSVITKPGESVIGTWASPRLWDALQDLGIELLHTGPVQRAGGLEGRRYTPTRDGWFDPISLDLDPELGTEAEYRRMVRVARQHDGLIAGDLVPLHTGTGADFRLALRAYRDYPGLYTMVEIAPEDWHYLPAVKGPDGLALLPQDTAVVLTRKGYIPGMINSCDADPEAASWSGWSATAEVRGVDGKVRRWVYLHYFKPTQPTLNWLDPSFAAQRVTAGNTVKLLHTLGARVLRLDAVPFLGIEPRPGKFLSVHYQHPLSITGTNETAFLVRKLGGWSFQELNVPMEELKKFTANGPDLSYDFFTRTQVLHALLTEDAGPLRLAFRQLLHAGVQPIGLVHDLQNHDEITYQLVELDHLGEKNVRVGGKEVQARALRQRMLEQMRAKVAGPAAPYNLLYRPARDGVATTFAGFVAPALGIHDPYNATPEQVARIRQGHLLLVAANALQPGVFSLSSWDLVGALPVSREKVKRWSGGGDERWVNRGGVDLLGANPGADRSVFGVPKAKALYGPVPEQLRDPESFASRLKQILAARKKVGLTEGELEGVPEPKEPGVCLLVLRLPNGSQAVTALNFARKEVEVDLPLGKGSAEKEVVDILTGKGVGKVGSAGMLSVRLRALAGTTFAVRDRR